MGFIYFLKIARGELIIQKFRPITYDYRRVEDEKNNNGVYDTDYYHRVFLYFE